jgi:hypothetical protein
MGWYHRSSLTHQHFTIRNLWLILQFLDDGVNLKEKQRRIERPCLIEFPSFLSRLKAAPTGYYNSKVKPPSDS